MAEYISPRARRENERLRKRELDIQQQQADAGNQARFIGSLGELYNMNQQQQLLPQRLRQMQVETDTGAQNLDELRNTAEVRAAQMAAQVDETGARTRSLDAGSEFQRLLTQQEPTRFEQAIRAGEGSIVGQDLNNRLAQGELAQQPTTLEQRIRATEAQIAQMDESTRASKLERELAPEAAKTKEMVSRAGAIGAMYPQGNVPQHIREVGPFGEAEKADRMHKQASLKTQKLLEIKANPTLLRDVQFRQALLDNGFTPEEVTNLTLDAWQEKPTVASGAGDGSIGAKMRAIFKNTIHEGHLPAVQEGPKRIDPKEFEDKPKTKKKGFNNKILDGVFNR